MPLIGGSRGFPEVGTPRALARLVLALRLAGQHLTCKQALEFLH